MSCASCAANIERRLRQLDGVDADVNFATERALVRHPDDVTPDVLIAAVEAAGYHAHTPEAPGGGHHDHDHDHGAEGLAVRLAVSTALAVPVVLISMLSGLHFAGWRGVVAALATPIVLWGAAPFHRSALGQPAARPRHHGHPRLDGRPRRLWLVALRPGVR